jgi:Holliday junction resolvase RusA-like endonuclease
MTEVTITLLGEPCAWRHRTSPDGKHRYLPAKQRDVSAALKLAAQEAMLAQSLLPFDEPVRLTLLAEFAVPASWSRKKRDAALLCLIYPTKKPDLDNLLKLAGDCLSGIVFRDDALVCKCNCKKRYGAQPKIVLTIEVIK